MRPIQLYHGNISGSKFSKPLAVGCIDSFADFPKKPPRDSWCSSYFFDSGAFSVWRRGGVVDIDKYIAHLKMYLSTFDVYAALDVIGDAAKSWDAYVYMKEAGLKPLPAFHSGEPWEWLHKYIDAGETYIGIGGVAETSGDQRRAFFREVFQRFPDPSKVGFHGYGVLDKETLLEFPWKSCDSRTASILGRFGSVMSPWGPYALNPNLNADRTQWRTDLAVGVVRDWVVSLGGDWELAQQATPAGKHERIWITIQHLEGIAKQGPETYNPRMRSFIL